MIYETNKLYFGKHEISEVYAKMNPRNCPVIEYTADKDNVGVCCFYLQDGKTCPRHGIIKELLLEEEKVIQFENRQIIIKIKDFLLNKIKKIKKKGKTK